MSETNDGRVPVEPAPEKPKSPERPKAQDNSAVKFARGQTFALDGEAYMISRVGGDGSTNDRSTVHYRRILPDGTLGAAKWIADWDLRKRLTVGEATFIDGAMSHTVVTLPPEWAAQVKRHYEAVAAAKAARIERGEDPLDEVQPMTHPSYGIVRLTRATSGEGYLFGSAYKHHGCMTIEIHRATLHRGLANDRPHPAEEIIEIDMSEAQFAHFITSAAVGEGTPCTIRHMLGTMMPPPPPPHETEKFHEDAKRTIRQAGRHVSEAIEAARALLTKPGTVTKKDREEIVHHLWAVERAFNDSLPYTVEQFGERMEKIVAAGKHEIDAYLTRLAGRMLPEGSVAPLSLTVGESTETER